MYTKREHEPINDDMQSKVMCEHGEDMYKLFNESITLNTNYRQNHKDATRDDTLFYRNIRDIGDGDIEEKDTYQYWSRFFDTAERRVEFKNDPSTVYLFGTNKEADRVNAEFVNDLSTRGRSKGKIPRPVHAWHAFNSLPKCVTMNHDKFWGLRRCTAVCKECPIMLLVNLWTEAGLANGSRGIVRDVIFDCRDGKIPNKNDVPLFVVCEFPGYTGPACPFFNGDVNKRRWVPIPQKLAQYSKRLYRMNIPICVSRALTVHKS